MIKEIYKREVIESSRLEGTSWGRDVGDNSVSVPADIIHLKTIFHINCLHCGVFADGLITTPARRSSGGTSQSRRGRRADTWPCSHRKRRLLCCPGSVLAHHGPHQRSSSLTASTSDTCPGLRRPSLLPSAISPWRPLIYPQTSTSIGGLCLLVNC